MKRLVSAARLLAGLLVAIPALAGEPLVVDLWPGKTPGDVGINGQETSRIHKSPLVGPDEADHQCHQADPHRSISLPGTRTRERRC